MRRPLTVLAAAILLCLAAVPGFAQAQVRAPVLVSAPTIDSIIDSHPFHPTAQIIVTDVEDATIEALEVEHTCAAPSDTGTHSVWFRTNLEPGTLTLDTSGTSYDGGATTTSNSIISLYRGTGSNVFADLTPMACSDNGANAGVISGAIIAYTGIYYVQVSAAPGVSAVDPSQVMLNATYAPDFLVINDEPDGAKKLKTPGLPTVIGVNSATTALNEPVDPLVSTPLTNTVWFKFTLNTRRAISFVNIYNVSSIRFSVFTRAGSVYTPAADVYQSDPNLLVGVFNAGEYYLRVGVDNDPAGSTSIFISFASTAVLTPPNYEFMAGTSEGTIGAAPSLDGWTVKDAAGDGAFCGAGECYFQFVSSGASENTQLKGKVALADVKLKTGDALVIQLNFVSPSGAPNLTTTLKLVDATGAAQKYTLDATDPENSIPGKVFRVAQGFTPVKAILKIKNKDTVLGHIVQIDSVAVQALRIGEGVRAAPLALPAPPPAQ